MPDETALAHPAERAGTPPDARSALDRLTGIVRSVWPEHAAYLDKSIQIRNAALRETSEVLAAAILELAAPHESEHAQDYRWLCDQIREEELNFARTGEYRYKTFAETAANVYNDAAFMRRYMNGLLLSQVLWHMHASSLHFFRQRVAARVKPAGSVLEVGSGHGLLLFLALRDLGLARATAWDLSEVSLEQTRLALSRLNALDRARFAVQDMHAPPPDDERYDLVILSHLLEHLEQPVAALRQVGRLLGRGALLYVNVPLNAPMPDHLILLKTPEDAQRLIVEGGFNIVEMSFHTTQGAPLSRALRSQTAVTCSVIAELA
jgi:ubiquinone/menaquinone biosynthesis C-methylase UbiE